jgi:hypothetical protein
LASASASAPVLVEAGAWAANTMPNTPAAVTDNSAVALVTNETRRLPSARITGPLPIPPTFASESWSTRPDATAAAAALSEDCGLGD